MHVALPLARSCPLTSMEHNINPRATDAQLIGCSYIGVVSFSLVALSFAVGLREGGVDLNGLFYILRRAGQGIAVLVTDRCIAEELSPTNQIYLVFRLLLDKSRENLAMQVTTEAMKVPEKHHLKRMPRVFLLRTWKNRR
jgi:hypothetical protein